MNKTNTLNIPRTRLAKNELDFYEKLLAWQRDFVRQLNQSDDLAAAVKKAIKILLSLPEITSGGVYLIDQKTGNLDLFDHFGLSKKFIDAVSHFTPQSQQGKLVAAGKPIFTSYENLKMAKDDIRKAEKLKSIAIIPILFQNKVIGCFNIASKKCFTVSSSTQQFLEIISQFLGAFIYRLMAEKRLREEKEAISKQQAHDQALLASIGEGVVAVNNQGRIIYINKAAESMFKTKAGLSEGKPVYEFFDLYNAKGKVVPFIRRPLHLTLKSGKPVIDSSLSVRLKDSSKFPAMIIASPVILKNKIIGAVGVFRDISKEKGIEAMKTEFVSVASHQLRTPLTAIRWYLEELYSGELGRLNKNQKDYLQQVIESNQHMVKLVDDLLNVSRLETGRININPVLTDLSGLINKTIDNHLPLANAKNCRVFYEKPAPRLAPVYIDPILIGSVLDNLVSNAIQYSFGAGGRCRVRVKVMRRGRFLKITVVDSGIGIPRENQRRIFEKFFRAGNAVKIQTEGSGLGLYIAKMIVEALGGRIWFESREKKGTSVSFTLPLAKITPKK